MKIVILSKGKERLNRSIEWLLYFISYSLVFIIVGGLFKSFYIDSAHPLLYSILATFILYILNKTVKPILVSLTIPITGVTLGLFYPFINLFVLKLVDWILGSHFDLKDFWVALVISILISVMNFVMEDIIIKPLIRRFRHE
jgi:putative membrane protein